MDDDPYGVWRVDAAVLSEIGRHLFTQTLTVRVRLPAALAAQARSSWERGDPDGELPANETSDQRTVRQQAGALALVGLSVSERSELGDNGDVFVEIDAWQIGTALDAAEGRDMLDDV